MNATDPTMVPPGHNTGMFGSPTIGGFGYGIGVSVGILLLITTITLASYFCTRTNHPQSSAVADDNSNNRTSPSTAATGHDIQAGLDEATLKTYPKLLYSQLAKTVHKEGEEGQQCSGTAASCCSVCLADYKDADVLRLLPDCKHVFHLKCVDPWLRQHPTCPVCRTSPLPSPLPTPLSEAALLARQV